MASHSECSVYCSIYLLIVRKWKKQGLEVKFTKRPGKRNEASRQISCGVGVWQKRQMNVGFGLVCLCDCLAGCLALSSHLFSTFFVIGSLSQYCFCSLRISSLLHILSTPLFLFTPVSLESHCAFWQYIVKQLTHSRNFSQQTPSRR